MSLVLDTCLNKNIFTQFKANTMELERFAMPINLQHPTWVEQVVFIKIRLYLILYFNRQHLILD